MNRIILIGNVGNDPEVRNIGESSKVANFSLATTERYTVSGEKQEDTEWHRLVVWNKLAGVVESYVKKGDKLAVTGKVKTRSWEKEGEKRYSTEVIVQELEMLGGKKSESDNLLDQAEAEARREESGFPEPPY